MAMAGRRLPRKPKKRPRIIQKQLDEIKADLYKVPDEADTGK
ncbi:hypothetical protein HanPI659440_Chr07g0256301 [Helianthus annuus]|nr:hypothetical protein HanPI659440_Chr07g0256301 [Helianthus annuus]